MIQEGMGWVGTWSSFGTDPTICNRNFLPEALPSTSRHHVLSAWGYDAVPQACIPHLTLFLVLFCFPFHTSSQKDYGYSPANIHFIGHSLGAHAAGEAGRRKPGIGRITGTEVIPTDETLHFCALKRTEESPLPYKHTVQTAVDCLVTINSIQLAWRHTNEAMSCYMPCNSHVNIRSPEKGSAATDQKGLTVPTVAK